MLERLQKVLAEGGVASRRECEQLIVDGRVEVDREVVTRLGTKVDPERHAIRVDGQPVKLATRKYFAVNKPRGVVSTNRDPDGRLRVVDLVATNQRIYTVGRLDKDSEGLILVTNDGSLAHRLTHPKFGVEKTYLIQVEGHPTREQMETIQQGVRLADGFAQVKDFQFKRKQKHTTEIEIVLDEGRNRELRRLLARIGHKVLWLRRTAIGSFQLDIPPGGNRQLDSSEIASLTKNPKRRSKSGGTKSGATKKKKAPHDRRSAPIRSKKKVDRRKSRSSSGSTAGGGHKTAARKKSRRTKVSGTKNNRTQKQTGAQHKKSTGRKKMVRKKMVRKKSKPTGGKKSSGRK